MTGGRNKRMKEKEEEKKGRKSGMEQTDFLRSLVSAQKTIPQSMALGSAEYFEQPKNLRTKVSLTFRSPTAS